LALFTRLYKDARSTKHKNPFIVAMEMQRLVTFALLSNYRIFGTAVNIHVLQSSREVPDVCSISKQISRHIFIQVPIIIFHYNLSRGSSADKCGQTDGWKGTTQLVRRFPRLCERTSNRSNARGC